MLRAKLSVVPALAIGIAALLAGCGSTKDDKTENWSPNKIHAEASTPKPRTK
jgi:outer membrane protein assembly factor BamD